MILYIFCNYLYHSLTHTHTGRHKHSCPHQYKCNLFTHHAYTHDRCTYTQTQTHTNIRTHLLTHTHTHVPVFAHAHAYTHVHNINVIYILFMHVHLFTTKPLLTCSSIIQPHPVAISHGIRDLSSVRALEVVTCWGCWV